MHHEDWLGFTGDGKTVGSGEGITGWRLMRERSVRLEDTPSYLLEAVDPEIIHKIEMRQKASWTRLSAAFPGDVARQDRVKEEHADSLGILRMQGHVMFALETKWSQTCTAATRAATNATTGTAGMRETALEGQDTVAGWTTTTMIARTNNFRIFWRASN
ncbi:unnamed protein product [Ascophyllum nodosum]